MLGRETRENCYYNFHVNPAIGYKHTTRGYKKDAFVFGVTTSECYSVL